MKRLILLGFCLALGCLAQLPATASASTADQIAALQKAVAALQTQVVTQAAQITSLQAQVNAKHSILTGSGTPAKTLGCVGDFYVDTRAWAIYGPKTASGWASPTSLIGPKGATGATGAAGPQGLKGDTGAVGPAGPQGPQGLGGDTGAVGPAGADGATGPTGATGATGATGPTGAAGANGATWHAGLDVGVFAGGDPGDFFFEQTSGNVYQKQNRTWTWLADLTGAQGEKGDQGDQGATGATGAVGPVGPVGPQGDKGEKGATGDVGPVGPAGPQGDAGATGATGAVGPAGPQGDKGDKGATGAVGPVGPAGPQGPQGEPGQGGSAVVKAQSTVPTDPSGDTIVTVLDIPGFGTIKARSFTAASCDFWFTNTNKWSDPSPWVDAWYRYETTGVVRDSTYVQPVTYDWAQPLERLNNRALFSACSPSDGYTAGAGRTDIVLSKPGTMVTVTIVATNGQTGGGKGTWRVNAIANIQ